MVFLCYIPKWSSYSLYLAKKLTPVQEKHKKSTTQKRPSKQVMAVPNFAGRGPGQAQQTWTISWK